MNRRYFLGSVLASAGIGLLPSRLLGAQASANGPYQLPELPYAYNALEPHIDEKTMRIHHDKHYAGYTRKFNNALANADDKYSNLPLVELLAMTAALPEPLHTSVRKNGGGFYNHTLFWKIMSPEGGDEPESELMKPIQKAFGSFSAMMESFAEAGKSRFGSGWAWLCVNEKKELFITSTPNQVNPLMRGIADESGTPILCLDVWEHAYYLNYQNRRADYIKAFNEVIDWSSVASLYKSAIG